MDRLKQMETFVAVATRGSLTAAALAEGVAPGQYYPPTPEMWAEYRAWTKDELSAATIRDMMQEGILAIILGFMSIIGFVIGVVITWQTLRGAILANIKEFASLRALGVSIGQLRGVVMELSSGLASSASRPRRF